MSIARKHGPTMADIYAQILKRWNKWVLIFSENEKFADQYMEFHSIVPPIAVTFQINIYITSG